MSDYSKDEEQEQEQERQREEQENDLSNNAGKLSFEPGGGPVMGIGSGLGIDLKDGGLEVQIAPGISI